jgi:hypothetical protein
MNCLKSTVPTAETQKLHFATLFVFRMIIRTKGRDSSVGTATGYGLDGPGIESRWGARFFAHVQTGPGAHLATSTMGTESFPGVKRPGRDADHPPSFSAEIKKEYSYTSTPPLGLRDLL